MLVDAVAVIVRVASVDVGEKTDAVELLASDLMKLLLQLDELLRIVLGVRGALRDVVRISPQLGHPVEDLPDHLEAAVLHLQEGQAVLDVDPNRLGSLQGRLHLVGYRKAAGVVVGANDAIARRELGQTVAQHVVGATEVEGCDGRGRVSIYCYWHGGVPP